MNTNEVNVFLKKKAATDLDIRMLALEILKKEKIKGFTVSIVIAPGNAVAKLNEAYRNKKGDTDVLSFESDEPLGGDIYISADRAKSDAKELKISLNEEMARLVVHGVLHLCGYDHIKNKDHIKMRKKEEKYLSEMGYEAV